MLPFQKCYNYYNTRIINKIFVIINFSCPPRPVDYYIAEEKKNNKNNIHQKNNNIKKNIKLDGII